MIIELLTKEDLKMMSRKEKLISLLNTGLLLVSLTMLIVYVSFIA